MDLLCSLFEMSVLEVRWGSGHLLTWTDISLDYDQRIFNPYACAAEDIDGDGFMDLLACGYVDTDDHQHPVEARICWVRGTGPGTFESTVHHFSRRDAKAIDIAFAPLSGGAHLDAMCTLHYPWADSTKALLYDVPSQQFVVSPAVIPDGRPLLTRLNEDVVFDLILSDAYPYPSALVEQGLGGGQFSLVQSLSPVQGAAFGRIIGTEGKDLITVSDSPPQIAVRRFLPGEVGVGDLEPGAAVAGLSIRPSIASSSAEVAWVGAAGGPVVVRIVDVSGRTIGMYNAQGPSWRWDLRDGSGARVAPGIYWIAMADCGGRQAYGKVVVVR
jgi:hypothetical protein